MTKEEAISYWITHKLSFLRYHFGKGKKTLPWLNIVCCEHYVSRLRGENCECPGREWCSRYNYPKWMKFRDDLKVKYYIERDKISYLLNRKERFMKKDYKKFIQTHKNNFWNNLRLGRKGREWIREYEDKHCGSFDEDCSKCMLHHWCMTRDGSWYEWTHPWEFITIPVENWLENHMWDWYQKHPCKKIQTCSCCGLKQRGSNYYLKTYSGWDYKDHKLICHHCWGHSNDNCGIVNGKLVPISHEEYEQSWKEYVKQSNREMEENHYGS